MNKFFRVPEGRFTTADIMRLMMPLIIEQFLVVLVGMADTAMVAGVGEEAISGVSLVDAINILLLQVFMALTAGGGVVIAQYIGKKDINKACDGAKQIIYLGFFIAAAVMSICLLFDGAILGFMFGSVDSKIMESARIYFVYSAISYPFISVYYGCATIFRVKGNGRTPLAGSVMMNVINIVLNAVLIFGYHMGVAGAAIATLISCFF